MRCRDLGGLLLIAAVVLIVWNWVRMSLVGGFGQ